MFIVLRDEIADIQDILSTIPPEQPAEQFRGFHAVPGCAYWPDFCHCETPCNRKGNSNA